MTKTVTSVIVRGLELRGAYGREASLDDWQAGKDFKIVGGPYCSIRDVPAMVQEGFQVLEICDHTGELIHRLRIVNLPDGGEFQRLD